MSKLEEARKSWQGKSDEWLYERLSNELTQKVEEIHRLLEELDEVKKLIIPDVSKSLKCDCKHSGSCRYESVITETKELCRHKE